MLRILGALLMSVSLIVGGAGCANSDKAAMEASGEHDHDKDHDEKEKKEKKGGGGW